MKPTPNRAAMAVLALVLLPLTSLAQNTAPVNQQPSSNPFNVQQPISTAGMYGRSFDFGNVSSRFHRGDANSTGTLRFPAMFIPIGGEQTLPLVYPVRANAEIAAPPDQADPFLREPFYPHLTSLIIENEVPRNLQKRLDAFRAERDQAAAAVIAKLAELKDLPADEASASWVAFEEQAAATWKKIETERAALLERLQRGGLWARGVKLVDMQELVWLSDADHRTIPLLDLGTLRHFTTGLSMDQRDLIGEFQLELIEPDITEGSHRSVLISATGSRIALPDKLTLEQSQALRAYLRTKAELKEEILTTMLPTLRDALWVSQVERTAVRLNQIQAPKFVRLAKELDALTRALRKSADDSPPHPARLIGGDSPIDLEAFAMLSGPQRRLLAYSNVSR